MAGFLLVLPAWGYGLRIGNLWLAFGGLPLAALMLYFSLAKSVCPACGKAFRVVGLQPANCMHCGAAYESTPQF